jgi:hypothetical protein
MTGMILLCNGELLVSRLCRRVDLVVVPGCWALTKLSREIDDQKVKTYLVGQSFLGKVSEQAIHSF